MKNIVLLITDTFRFDNLSNRARRPIRTPALDTFSEQRGTSVDGFHTGSFPTIPHRTDLATGKLVWPHFPWQPIDLSSQNHIARLLGKQGYVSQLICDCPHLFNARFQHSFTAAFQHRGQEGDKHLLHLNDEIPVVMPHEKTRQAPIFRGSTLADAHRWINRNVVTEAGTFSARTAATTVQWLEENYQASPFFLWVDFFDPHEPWDAPEYLVKRYDPEYDGTPMIHCNYGPATDYTDAELHNLWAHYAAETELVDRHLGSVLQKIDDLELWDDTIVVITSDHGTSIGEHNRTGKSNICDHDERFWPIYPEVSHVPFLIGGGDIPQGVNLELLAQPIDILPTVSELAGVDLEPRQPIEGISFASCLLDGKASHRKLSVTGGFVKPTSDGAVPPESTTPWITDGRWGFAPVGHDGTAELFDLSADPLAEQNIANDHPEVIASLFDGFIDHLQSHDAGEELVQCWTKQ